MYRRIFFPNAFSPNDDGRNDTFRAYIDCAPRRFHLAVFNRWGGKVFESTGPEQGWDGRIQGEPAPTGLYAYVLEYEFGEGMKAREYGQLSAGSASGR